jgi:hypothetical protein
VRFSTIRMKYSGMFCANKLIAICLLLLLPIVSFGAQKRRRKTSTTPKTAVATPAPKPSTLLGCGVSLRVPPGWELSVAKKREADEAQEKPNSAPDNDASTSDTSATADSQRSAQVEMLPCSFVLAPKAPSALVKNTEAEGPVGEMELRVVEGDLDSAAANIYQKNEKGWYAQDSKGIRADAKLTKQKTMQILTAVMVQRCYDKSGKSRGLCESSKYVYSNGKKNLLVTAGPYLGETEYSILNSVRFVGTGSPARTRAKH